MTQLTLNNLTKHFDDNGNTIIAVEDVSIDIADGEFIVLVGPSGCGKSTTLRMIAGLESITEGEIRIGNENITDRPAKNRNIAMVFQSYALYPHKTVRENMSFGLEQSTDLPKDEIRTRVESSAEMMGIDDLLDRKPSELSGGQQQRVALGRAIVRDPAAFLMDEPLSNLDAKLRSQMRTELQQIQENLGVSTVYVTHDQTEAMTMGDRIAILNDGRLQQVAPPLECYHRPANHFVAGFLGEPSMNFIDMRYENGVLTSDAFDYPLPAGIDADLAADEGQRLTLGIRPEDIVINAADEENTVSATVTVVEPKGNENNVNLQLTDTFTITATTDGMISFEETDLVTATFPPETIHIFDGETGNALHNRDFTEKEPESAST